MSALENGIRQQASLDDHTLKQLADLGHPYRQNTAAGETYFGVSKGGQWRAGIRAAARKIREGILGHDIKLVHRQSGTLLGAIRRELKQVGHSIVGRVWVDAGVAPYVKYVVLGTSRMIPRDFIGIGAMKAKSAIFRIIRSGVNDAIKAK